MAAFRTSWTAMVLAVGFLLLVSLVISAALAVMGKFFAGFLPMPALVLSALDVVVSLAGTAVLFALIFRYVPETKISWKEVWIGAAATALLFTIGKFSWGFTWARLLSVQSMALPDLWS